MKITLDKKIWRPAIIILLLCFLITGGLIINFYRIQKAYAINPATLMAQLMSSYANFNVRGWLWSENMGWFNTNCYNDYDYDSNNAFNCCCPDGPGGSYCPDTAETCPTSTPLAGAYYGLQADIDGGVATNNLEGYLYAENYQNWASSSAIGDAGNKGFLCVGAMCGDITAPDTYLAWSCVGTRKTSGACLSDCGQQFNVTSTQSCTQDYVPIANLVAHWTFDSVVNAGGGTYKTPDISGNGLDATLDPTYPTLSPRRVTGRFKNDTSFTAAMAFNNENNPSVLKQVWATVQADPLLDLTGNITLEGWINLKGNVPGRDQIMLRKAGAYALGYIPASYDRIAAMLYIGGGWQTYYFSDDYLNDNYRNKWRHIALTYDGAYVRLYLDGVLDRVYYQVGNINTSSTSPLYIGGENPSVPYTAGYFNGYLDNVAIYSRVKTNEEIWQDAHQEITGWAKILTADVNDGWISLHGSTPTNYNVYLPNTWPPNTYPLNPSISESQTWGMYLNDHSQGGNFYTLGGKYKAGDTFLKLRTWAWSSDDSLGWVAGSHFYANVAPQAFDSFNAINIPPIGGNIATQLNWSASNHATYYIFWRCQGVLSGCNAWPTNYDSFPVPYYACQGGSCTTNDDNDGLGLQPNTSYCYKMIAWNNDGSKAATDNPPNYPQPFCIVTPPSSPTNDVLVNGNVCGQIQTIWNPTSGEEAIVDGYNLYRGLTGASGQGCNSSLTGPGCTLVAHAGEGVKSSNLSAQWRMNESGWSGQGNEVIDASGNQNNGTASASGATTIATNAKFNRSGIFTGGKVTVLDSDSLDFTASDSFTIGGWVNTTSTSGELLYKIQKPNGSGYEIYLSSGHPTCHFFKNPGQSYTLVSTVPAINNNQWHYVACVVNRSSGLLKVFVDNNFDSSTLDVSTMGDISNGENIIIGEGYNGMLDNWTVVKEARSHTDLLLESESQPISSICNVTSNQSFKYGINQTIFACSSGDKCCMITDKRGNPNTTYYYWLTQTAGGCESPAKSPTSGCNQVNNSNYRVGCDKTVCQLRVQTKEK